MVLGQPGPTIFPNHAKRPMSGGAELEGLLRTLPETVCFSVLVERDLPHDHLKPVEASALSERAVPSRRESFRLGRAAARSALAGLGAGRPAIPVGDNREPVWPEGVVGSITHAGRYAIAAVAWSSEVFALGVDLELRRPFAGLRERVAFGEELAWLESLDPAEADIATIEVFSAKEAIFKAFHPGVGRFFGFDSAKLEPAVSRDHYRGYLAKGLADAYPPSRSFRVDIGWHRDVVLATVCLESD